MSEVWSQADLHAYVDGCLPAVEMAQFENRMAIDPALAKRAAEFKRQNSAIRSSFGMGGGRLRVPDIGRQANENAAARKATPHINRLAPKPNPSAGAKIVRVRRRRSRVSAALGRAKAAIRAGAGVVSLAVLMALAPMAVGSATPHLRLSEAALAAYRAFATSAGAPVEFATHDPLAAQAWFAQRLQREIDVPDCGPADLTLVGARIAPAVGAAAAFLVYETRDRRRVGLLIQPLDAPAPEEPTFTAANRLTAAIWTGASHGFVLVGEMPRETAGRMVRSIVEAPPA